MGSKMHKHTGTTYCKEHPSHPPQIPPFWPVGDGAASSMFLPGALGQDQRNPGKKGTEKVGNRFPEASETHHRLAPRMGVPPHTLAAEQSVGLPSAMGCLQGAVFGSCWAGQDSSSFPFQERVEAHVHLCTHSHQLTSWNSKIHIFLSLFPPSIILALTPSGLFPTSLCTPPPELSLIVGNGPCDLLDCHLPKDSSGPWLWMGWLWCLSSLAADMCQSDFYFCQERQDMV